MAIAHSVTMGIALIPQLTNVKFAHHQAANLWIFPLSITYVHVQNVNKTFTCLRVQWYVPNARIQTAQFAPTMCAQNARFFITCRARVREQVQWQVVYTGRRQRPARHAATGTIWEVIANVIHANLIAENAVTDSLVLNATQTFTFIRAVRVVWRFLTTVMNSIWPKAFASCVIMGFTCLRDFVLSVRLKVGR